MQAICIICLGGGGRPWTVGCRCSRLVTFMAIRLRSPGFKPRPRQKL